MTTESIKEDTLKTFNTAFWNTFANVLSLIIGTVMVPIITRVLNPEELGIASTFIANRNTIVIFVTLSVYSYVNHAMIDFDDNRKGYLASISLFCTAAVSAAFIICLPFKAQIMALLSLDEFLYNWMFVSILCFALFYLAYYYCVFKNKSKIVFWITLTIGPVSQILSVAFALAFHSHGEIGRVIGLDAVYIVTALSLAIWLVFSKKESCRIEAQHVSKTLAFTIPLIPHLLSQMILTQCDLIMITALSGAENSGIYSMGHTISNLAFTVMSQIMAVWSPWVYRRLADRSFDSIKSNSKLVIFLGAYLSCGLMTIAPEVIRLFLPSSYAPTGQITPPLVMSMFIQFAYLFLYDIEYFYKKPHLIALSSILTAIINVCLNLFFIPRVGYLSTCYVTLFSYVCLFAFNFYFADKLNARGIYNMPVLIGTILSVFLFMILSQMLYEAVLVRYLMMGSITVILFLSQKTLLIKALKLMKPSR